MVKTCEKQEISKNSIGVIQTPTQDNVNSETLPK